MGSNETIHGRFQQAPYTAAQLTQTNPVLLDGEVMHESDTGKYKIGDGRTAWNNLPYKSGETATGEPFVVAYYSSPITTSRINFIHNNGYNANVTLANPYNNPGVPHVVFVQMFAGTTVLTDATGADITAQKGWEAYLPSLSVSAGTEFLSAFISNIITLGAFRPCRIV